ncbi:uncharacterized protein LOC123216365 [Mangifera indica]|uniref:uncharacterized protein LOC123216365 n=1 Tax=Mangifera indica TaxID=29780 RepID=UPI001CFB8D75|nr:uncharacterized protein LOC123216365 [Mangifera indica]
MEAYNCSSSSAYSQSQQDSGDKVEYVKASNCYQSSLHAVRKAPLKPWKKPIAPVPPAGPKVYKVDPVNFRELVQRLTGASECQLQRLKRVAPPPLNVTPISCHSRENYAAAPLQLLPSPAKTPLTALYTELMAEISDPKPQQLPDCGMESNSLGLSLSPSSHSWCTFPLLSPGTFSSLDQSTVL